MAVVLSVPSAGLCNDQVVLRWLDVCLHVDWMMGTPLDEVQSLVTLF